MPEIICSPELKKLINDLDDHWESSRVEDLPFPLAYTLERLRQEDYSWDFLLKDMLHMLLKYLAIVSAADYLHTSEGPDFDVNDELKQLMRNMSEGHWLRIFRACSSRKGTRVVPELPEIFERLEQEKFTARISFERFGLKTERQGVLSTLLTCRNKLFGHGMSPTSEEKEIIGPQIMNLIRAALHVCAPLWKYGLAHRFEAGGGPRFLLLRGNSDFQNLELVGVEEDTTCLLLSDGAPVLKLFPVVFSSRTEKHEKASILNEESELYLLNHIARKQYVPSYMGLNGGDKKRKDLKGRLQEILQGKRVMEKRADIELENVLMFSVKNTEKKVENAERNNQFAPDLFVERKKISAFFRAFIEDPYSRALFVSGDVGSGKTASAIHFINRLNKDEKPTILIRASELPTEIVKGRKFEQWLTAELGFKGSFQEILGCASSAGGRFVLLIDGLNEFDGAGRDSSILFRAINKFMENHAENPSLKIIMTTRSDSLDVFLPSGSLPADMDEKLYFRPHGTDHVGIGQLTEQEALDIMLGYEVEEGTARKFIAKGRDKILNPALLHKAISGAVRPEDFADMDSIRITSSFLDKRLSRDKELTSVVGELVGLMSKARDLTLSEDLLAEKAPKLLDRLQAKNWAMITTLKELEILQQVETEGESGEPTWSLAFAHDTIFEALARKQAKKRLLTRIVNNLGVLGIMLACIFFIQHSYKNQLEEKYGDLAGSSREILSYANFPEDIAAQVLAEYQKVLSGMKFSFETGQEYIRNLAIKSTMVLSVTMITIFMIQAFWNFRTDTKDRRPVRMLYFGRDNDNKLFKKLVYRYAYPMMLAAIIWTVVNIFSNGLEAPFIEYAWPLLIAAFILIMVFIPASGLVLVSSAQKGSPLLKEYVFSLESRKKRFHSFLEISLIYSGVVALLILFSQLSGSIFVGQEFIDRYDREIARIEAGIDFELIDNHPISDSIWDDKDELVRLLKLNGLVYNLKKSLSGKIMSFDSPDPEERYSIWITAFSPILIILMTGLGQVIIPSMAARKYYRSLEEQNRVAFRKENGFKED